MKFWNLEASQLADGTKVLDISLFGEIDPGFFGDGVASKEIASQLKAHADASEITVRINSVGGDLFGGMAIYNLIRGHGAKVTTIVEGLAASAASIVAMAGRTVMNRGAMMMIHNPMTVTVGDANDHREQAEVLDKAQGSLLAVYQAKTGKKPAALKKLLDAETWMTAEEAKREGFADEVADKPTKARATAEGVLVNSVAFKRDGLPAALQALTPPKAQDAVDPAPEAPPAEPAPETEKPTDEPAAPAPEAPSEPAPAATPAEDPVAASAKAYAAGVADERARLKAIDELELTDCDSLVVAAKYGEQPMSAGDLAVAAIRARKAAGMSLIEARRNESKEVAGVRPTAPQHIDAAAKNANDERLVRAIVGNDQNGGVR